MSYAIETKKRKFDRILESLTDGAASSSRTSLNSRDINLPGRSSLEVDLSKRRRVTPNSTRLISKPPADAHYLPSSRLAYLERLETFRHVTKWHIPSTALVNASEWAKRGWTCADTDIVTCGFCRERLAVSLDVENGATTTRGGENEDSVEEEEGDNTEIASEIYTGLVKRYQQMIATAHADICPWRSRGCDASIQRIEGLLNASSAMVGLQSRYDSITDQTNRIPAVEQLPNNDDISAAEDELVKAQLNNEEEELDLNAARLAACGWQRKEGDVVECKHCFRSLGLWLYRGDEPIMEHLDPIGSHLEYCPWISADAQDTTVTLRPVRNSDATSRIVKLPGWSLTILAITRLSAKRNANTARGAIRTSSMAEDSLEAAEATPEQREKRMKDLMRRIRDIKKPFNVKSLLRRKDKPIT